MNHLVEAIRVAGVIQLVIIAVNLLLPGRLRVREQLATAPRLIRQIFYAHWAYIVLVLGLFSALCLAFPAELAGACGLGRFLSAFLATFGCRAWQCNGRITTEICAAPIARWTVSTRWR